MKISLATKSLLVRAPPEAWHDFGVCFGKALRHERRELRTSNRPEESWLEPPTPTRRVADTRAHAVLDSARIVTARMRAATKVRICTTCR